MLRSDLKKKKGQNKEDAIGDYDDNLIDRKKSTNESVSIADLTGGTTTARPRNITDPGVLFKNANLQAEKKKEVNF